MRVYFKPMIRIPIAEHLRPTSLDDVVGQEHLLGTEGILSHVIRRKKPLSIILWGPPGCGKTSISRLYAKEFSLPLVQSARFSAASVISVASSRKPKTIPCNAKASSYSSMRSTGSTKPSKTLFCHSSKTAP